jgi:Na+-transporting methylmalonyl-CoA/oxaloacetate decarboxylase gamma subunit
MHGVQITATGMLLVFFTLGLIIVAMILLTKLPWLRPKEEETVPEPVPAPPAKTVSAIPAAAVQSVSSVTDELAYVAAIAAVLSQQQRVLARGGIVRPQVRSASRWKLSGRSHQIGLSTFD